MSAKKVYQIHKWSGLLAGLFILLMGVTGSILVFHEELEALEYRKEWTIPNNKAVRIDRALKTVIAKFPGWDIRLQRFSSRPTHTLIFQLRRPDARLIIFVHPSQGNIIKVMDQKDGKVYWILKLHYSLHSGIIGESLILLVGLTFILSLVTGLIVYRKALLDILTFKTRFLKKRKRSLVSSLHRYVGVWALVFNLLIVLTGTVISFEIVKSGIKNKSAITSLPDTPKIGISVDQILKELHMKQPDFNPSYIRFPTLKGNPIIIAGKVTDEAILYSKFYNTVSVSPVSGEVSALQITKSLSSLVRGIHFVEYGNLWIKLFFCLVGISGPVLSISGFLLWKWKKKA
ncbi:PepSY domain-containing protein [Daejeonella sp.]|uniref:PepSY-associated TM helix domain-containing protein n=1 Tax=Daejeonella sp. TaxID=2805397 RepID=UPI00271BD04F|nr:PepSY-associated TM helix domain-containing protein [Daejeonella sp.]MDO8992278.1 PepSY-associated TM helix domain-containing protein [Daejeonella sp.]MDP2412736.1 PepSY-associated TM helix domain-containing protein [Daejeonella sp.]